MEQSSRNHIIFVALLLIFCLTSLSRASDNKDNKLKDALRNNTNSKTKYNNKSEQNDSNEDDNILKTESQKMLKQCGVERNESSSSNTDYNRYNNNHNNGNYNNNNNNYRNGNSNRNSYNNKYGQNQETDENQNGFYGNSRNNNNNYANRNNNNNNYNRYNKGENDNEGSNSNNDNEEWNSYSSQYGNENQNDSGHNNNNNNNGFTNKRQQPNYYGQTNSENNGYGEYGNQNNQYGNRNRNSRPNGSNFGQNIQGNPMYGSNNEQGYGYGLRSPSRGNQGSSTNTNDVRSSNWPNRGYNPGAGPNDDCDDDKGDRGYNRNIFGYNTGMTLGLNNPHSRQRRFNFFNREENDNDENTQCVSQCVFGYLHLLDDDRTPSETMVIKWLQEHVTGNDMERIKSLRDARRCFARLTTSDIEDGCEFSKELSKCLELDLE